MYIVNATILGFLSVFILHHSVILETAMLLFIKYQVFLLKHITIVKKEQEMLT